MTASPATRSKDFRERRKAKLARYDELTAALVQIKRIAAGGTSGIAHAVHMIAEHALDPSPNQGQPA